MFQTTNQICVCVLKLCLFPCMLYSYTSTSQDGVRYPQPLQSEVCAYPNVECDHLSGNIHCMLACESLKCSSTKTIQSQEFEFTDPESSICILSQEFLPCLPLPLVHCHIGSPPCLLLPGLLQCWSERSEQLCSKASWHHIFMLSPNINQIVFRFRTMLRYPRRELMSQNLRMAVTVFRRCGGNPTETLVTSWKPGGFRADCHGFSAG